MKEKNKYIFYFVFIAPLLAKILEWVVQYFTYSGLSHLSNYVWLFQIVFIESLSFMLYFIFEYLQRDRKNYILIAPLAYFLKELYNSVFIFQVINFSTLIALLGEPIIILFITYVPYKLIFEKR
jgi:hypothetical protein